MKDTPIRIAIGDDHALIRQGLKSIISFEKDLEVVVEAENGERILELVRAGGPEILLLDVNMPVMDGMRVLKTIREEKLPVRVIMLTIENQRQTILEAIHNGVDGYVLKDSAGEEIIDAIRMVYRGEKYIDKSLVSVLFTNIKYKNYPETHIFDNLSKREIEVLLKISKGFSNKEIGEQMYLAEKTIKNYATNVFAKINANDRVGATIIALENHISDYYRQKFGEQGL